MATKNNCTPLDIKAWQILFPARWTPSLLTSMMTNDMTPKGSDFAGLRSDIGPSSILGSDLGPFLMPKVLFSISKQW